MSGTSEPAAVARRLDVTHDVSIVVGRPATMAARIVLPDPGTIPQRPVVLCCVPGGASSRRYFDLGVAPGDDSYSFAAFAAGRGLITVAVDNLGSGDSICAEIGQLTPHQVAQANSSLFDHVVAGLRDGTLTSGLPPLPSVATVGVGHSMGGMLTVLAQEDRPAHAGVALLGFSLEGLPHLLTERESRLAHSPDRWTGVLGAVAAERFGRPSAGETVAFPFHLDDTPTAVVHALAATRTRLLPQCGLLALIPGGVENQAAGIDVPVFLGGGDHEPWHRPGALTAAFPASRDVTFYVLPDCAHNHNIAIGRNTLWARICRWTETVVADRDERTAMPMQETMIETR